MKKRVHSEAVRNSALAWCFSVAEYACPVWGKFTHAKQIDTALNDTVHIKTGCLKPTPVDKLYSLTGIVPPRNHHVEKLLVT